MDDILDDILSEPVAIKAPTRAKFQPKAKVRPKKGPPISAPSAPKVVSVEQPVTSLPVDSSDQVVTGKEVNATIDGNLSADAREEVVGSTVARHSRLSNLCTNEHLNADTSLGFKSPGQLIGQSTIATDLPAEAPTLDASTSHTEEELSVFPGVVFTSDAPVSPCRAQTADDHSIPLTEHASGNYEEDLVNTEDLHIETEQGAGDFEETSDADLVSGKRARKFQPKPKAQFTSKRDLINDPEAPKSPAENQYMRRVGSTDVGEAEMNCYLSPSGFDGEPSFQSASAQHDNVVSEDLGLWMPSELPKENISGVLDSPHKCPDDQTVLLGVDTNENDYMFLGSENVGTQEDNNSPAKTCDGTTNSREQHNEDGSLGEGASKKKRQRKTKKVASENDKPTEKRRKKSKDDECTKKTPKKFPRGTRRRKRSVDKVLLEKPEDELDLQTVPIRDLIILAEYRERQAKKEAETMQPPTNERNGDDLLEDLPYDDDGAFGSDQDTGSLDNPSIPRVQNDANYFNYQTHMRRKKARWSKQDTELFYKGIQQFGSDLSMIAELFPGRDRHQIKLKYKREERQYPTRLNDALSSRAPDHSHFELVIQRLQERAAQKVAEEEQMSDEGNSVHSTGEEERPADEGTLETNDTASKSGQKEGGLAADREPNQAQVASPAKSYHSEDDDFDWNTYQSEL